MSSWIKRWLGPLLAAGFLVQATPAVADSKAVAATLFEEGRKDLNTGKTAQACEKFAESLKLNRSSGPALYLAICYEKLGKLASAWASYGETERIAREQNRPEHVDLARKNAADLVPRLSHLVLVVKDPPAGFSLQCDDELRAEATWDVDLPADPGVHVIVAEAPGYRKLETQVVVLPDARRTVFVVGPLERLDGPEVAPGQTPAPAVVRAVPSEPVPDSGQPKETQGASDKPPAHDSALPWVIGGTGVAAVLGGIGAGVVAHSKYEAARSKCGNDTRDCPPSAIKGEKAANDWANVANALTVAGAAGMVVAAILLLTADDEKEAKGKPAAALTPAIAHDHWGATWTGSF